MHQNNIYKGDDRIMNIRKHEWIPIKGENRYGFMNIYSSINHNCHTKNLFQMMRPKLYKSSYFLKSQYKYSPLLELVI